ncbi:MAG: efflux RND transporter periplasmic adaptor subunit [Proteobacteria bacterium]|nr:efflux RND transporter periplasmic adaptor subunit [Pseudomonadota bacterium]MBU1739645.1 efflux RND transporter periplasmic adaptor subunit [Pseudomonadota bacterium]
MNIMKKKSFWVVILIVAICSWFLFTNMQKQNGRTKGGKKEKSAPVEVAAIERGSISLRRTFNGTLEARAEFVVAPKVAGRVERLTVNLADTVKNGRIVAELDNDEYVQAIAQAKADLAVSRANLGEAESALTVADREFERVKTLQARGIASESQLDEVMSNQSAKQAGLAVARAQVKRAEALLETANIRLGYTKVSANWSGDDDRRVVAERYVDEGQTVSANAPLILIVALDPITGIIFVTEQDYARMQPGQIASLTTDSYPGEFFEGRIDRISPVFQESTRQARIELTIDNPQFRLKPGMFIRAVVELQNVSDAVIIPEQALVVRDKEAGIFLVNDEKLTVSWKPVQVGIREGGRVQIEGEGLSGRVVTLGHQLVDDGSAIIIGDEEKSGAATGKKVEKR